MRLCNNRQGQEVKESFLQEECLVSLALAGNEFFFFWFFGANLNWGASLTTAKHFDLELFVLEESNRKGKS